EGVDAFGAYLQESYGVSYPVLPKMRKWAMEYYFAESNAQADWGDRPMKRVSAELGTLRDAIKQAEDTAVETARQKLAMLEGEHAAMTRAWVKASESMQRVLKADIDKIEADMTTWKPRTMPLSERLGGLYAAESKRSAEREKLLAEFPGLEQREKGTALL